MDDFEEKLRDHLHQEAREVDHLPRSLIDRIETRTGRRRQSFRFGFAAQTAMVAAVLVLGIGIGFSLQHPQVASAITAEFSRLVAPTPTPHPFLCTDRSGGQQGVAANLTAIRIAPHPGYDRVTFQFDSAIPAYNLARQGDTTFIRDASGQPVTLDGQTGVKVQLQNSAPQGVPTDLKPNLAGVKELQQVGAFERVLSYGIGVQDNLCFRTLELSSPPRLVLDFDTSGLAAPAASASPSQAPVPTPSIYPMPTAGGMILGPFSCSDQSGGTAGGQAQLVAVRTGQQQGYERLVFEFGPNDPLPQFQISRQGGATFVKDPSGQNVTLQGSAGVRIILRGVTGQGTYTGGTDLKAGLTEIKEVAELGDFERVTSWGAGLSAAPCYRVIALTNPTRLVIDFQAG